MMRLRLLGIAALAAVLLAACSRNPNDDWVPQNLDRQVWTSTVSLGALVDLPGIPAIPDLPIGIIPNLYIDLQFGQELGSQTVTASATVHLRATVPPFGTIDGNLANLGTSTGHLDPETGVLSLESDTSGDTGFSFEGRFRGFRLLGQAWVNGVVFNTTFLPRTE